MPTEIADYREVFFLLLLKLARHDINEATLKIHYAGF
jgi:hypothetical protein